MKKIIISSLFCLFLSNVIAQNTNETIIFLVRHAEKSNESSDNPSLSEKGKLQAEALANTLSDVGVKVIYSTDTKRTKGTAEPLAKKLALSINTYEAKDKNFRTDIFKKHAGKKILIISHSGNLPDYLNYFSKSQNYKPSDNYGELYVIVAKNKKKATILKLYYTGL